MEQIKIETHRISVTPYGAQCPPDLRQDFPYLQMIKFTVMGQQDGLEQIKFLISFGKLKLSSERSLEIS